MPIDRERAETFARLLGSLQEGVFVGLLTPVSSLPSELAKTRLTLAIFFLSNSLT